MLKKLIPYLTLLLTALLLTTNLQTALADTSAKSTVEKAVNDIVKLVESYPGEAKLTERRQKLRELIEPLFDFKETAKLSLGAKWNEATKEEQDEFIKVYTDYLGRTYLSKIETVERGMVRVDSEKTTPNFTIVHTTVTKKGQEFPLDYKLKKNVSGTWRVYDVYVESIGLVTTNRADFAGVVRKHKISGLIQMLKEKNTK